jgi:hypothetical protein
MSLYFLKYLKISGTFPSFSCLIFPFDLPPRPSCMVEADIVSKEEV